MTLDAPTFPMDGTSSVSNVLELTPKALPASLAPPISIAPKTSATTLTTPPTPEGESDTTPVNHRDEKEMSLDPMTSVPEPTTPSLTTGSLPETPITTGFKRTASGMLKGPGSTTSTLSSPGLDEESEESEKRRAVDPSRIAELSTNLRTRLTYALLKLQNGWEKHSLDQVEELASQVGSPMSTVGRNSAISSPARTVRGINLRRGSEGGFRAYEDDEPHHSRPMDIPQAHRLNNGTYESFWRKHPPAHSVSRSYPDHNYYPPPGSSLPTESTPSTYTQNSALAPPAPIFSRRPTTFAPPMLRRDTSTMSTASAASGFSTISASSYGSAASSFSVTGDDELEREAVRGLMWLASPGARRENPGKRSAQGREDGEDRGWKRREREVEGVGGGRWR